MTVDVRGYTRAVLATAGPELRRGDRSTLMAITLHANAHTGETFVKAETIAGETGMTAGGVRKCIDRLEAAGRLVVERRPGRASLLRLPAAPIEVIHTPRPGTRGDDDPPRALGRDTPRPRARTPRALGRDVNSQGTVRETLPTIHVANGFAVTADESEEFEVSPDIYARIGHRLGPKATPRGAVQ